MHRSTCLSAAVSTLAIASLTSASHAAVLDPGFVYQAHNHPDGGARTPLYGLRLDELYDATQDVHDIFTFDFDFDDGNFTSAVFVTILELPNVADAFRIFISGSAWGGRDIGDDYAADQYRGEYEFEFSYLVGVGLATPDDDYIVDPNPAKGLNSGWIRTPLGHEIDLTDESGDKSYTFRLGDTDDESGHRGFDGVSGWGWLNHNNEPHVAASDWLFTVDGEPVPTPGALALFGASGLVLTRRRR